MQTNRQLRLRKILRRRYRSSANLLHCRSPFYLCLEHVDNLGAYSIPSETGLLIPSDYDSELRGLPANQNLPLEILKPGTVL